MSLQTYFTRSILWKKNKINFFLWSALIGSAFLASIYCVTILLVSYGGYLLPAFNSSIQNFFLLQSGRLTALKTVLSLWYLRA